MVCLSTVCSCLAGTSNENENSDAPSGWANFVAARVSGVRHACIIHQRVAAAIVKRASDTATIVAAIIDSPPLALESSVRNRKYSTAT